MHLLHPAAHQRKGATNALQITAAMAKSGLEQVLRLHTSRGGASARAKRGQDQSLLSGRPCWRHALDDDLTEFGRVLEVSFEVPQAVSVSDLELQH